MYLDDYIFFLIAIGLCAIFSMVASISVRTTYSKYSKVPCRSGMSGYEAAAAIIRANKLYSINIGRVSGELSDHYDPSRELVNLSDSTHSGRSVAAVAVAAHEMGHVMQKHTGYLFYRIRTAIVPVVRFASYLAMPLVLIGLVIDYLSLSLDPELGFHVAMVGVLFYGGSLLFALVTLPVELNASHRACRMLVDIGIIESGEVAGAKKVLAAAAMTYLASLLTSLVYFLRFLVRVLTMFGRRNDR